MPAIYVKPVPGGRVRMPERNFTPMPETGANIELSDYYNRLIVAGDLVITEPPSAPEAPVADEPETQADAAPAKRTSKEK